MFFDTHCHLNAEQFRGEIEGILENAKQADVKFMLVVGFDRQTIEDAVSLAEAHEH
ncbi:MAG: TatD family hydrolase, partial [Culicoidibacterales bacterium]